MSIEESIRSILECYFAGFKEEIIDRCCKRICYELKLKDCIENMSEQESWKKGL